MAVEFDVPNSRRSELWINPDHITIPHELNGRHELPDVSWLVESILEMGQLQSVSIRKTNGLPVLTAGFSRWRAVKHINDNQLYKAAPLELKCSYTQLTEKQAFLANIAENRVRNATTPMDDAYNLQRLINVYQMTEEDAGAVYRQSAAWVRSSLKLLEVSPEVEREVRSGRIKPSAAKAIAKLSKDSQKKVLAKQGNITARDVAAESPKAAAFNLAQFRGAIKALLAECALQPDVMVYEIHKDTINEIKRAVEGK